MATRRANPAQGNGKAPNAEAMALAEVERIDQPAKPENRYLRGMRVIANGRNVSPEDIAKQADMSKSGAKACIIAWNTAVRLLDEKKALAVPAADLVNNSLKPKATPLSGTVLTEQLETFGLEMVPDDTGNGWRIQKRA
jgi:hypothetical protein